MPLSGTKTVSKSADFLTKPAARNRPLTRFWEP